MLQKYLVYARRCIHPKLQDVDREKITSFYSDIRKFSSTIGGIPIGVRHIESMIRMSEAHAKMHLRQYVKPEDINMGIRMLLESFLSSQKASVAQALRPKFHKHLQRSDDDFQYLLHILG